MDKKRKKEGFRHGIQMLWAVITNSYLAGFLNGKIYQGSLKQVCVPGLNCYSCPGALGSCPIGSLQAVLGSRNYKFTFYLAGFFIFIGAFMGRFVCGWLCPFGLIQDLLNKIPFKKKIHTVPGDKLLRKIKYLILLVFVILLPLFCVDILGQGTPYFCKWICPSGTLEGGIPLVLLNDTFQGIIGWLYTWKMSILLVLLCLSIIIYRPFCKYICPLGAIYSVFNPIALVRYKLNEEACVHCGTCEKVCPMQVNPVENVNALECIRCGKCAHVCPTDAIYMHK